MNINWHNIRPINGDQKEGFEELISQLARKEIIPNQSKFIRKGKPDAGVECFWILNDNNEWAWQAKYFTSSLGDSQWSQLDESVKTVIAKHKRVVKYFISPLCQHRCRLKYLGDGYEIHKKDQGIGIAQGTAPGEQKCA